MNNLSRSTIPWHHLYIRLAYRVKHSSVSIRYIRPNNTPSESSYFIDIKGMVRSAIYRDFSWAHRK